MNTLGRRSPVAVARAIAAVLCAAAGATQIFGCASRAAPPDVAADRYAGPPIHLEADPLGHIVVIEAPSGGWSVTLDGVYDAFKSREVFITIMRPNPLGLHTQAVVEQRIATFVPTTMELRVFARVAPYAVKPDEDQLYTPVQLPASPE